MMRPLLVVATLLALASTVSAQQLLQQGEPVERTLAAGDAHAYALDLDAGQFVLGAVDQISVDVEITLAGPDGERIQSFDRPARGPEPFRFSTETAGAYTLTVTPFGGEEGRYVMRLVRAEPVATTPERAVDQLFAGFDERSPGLAVAVIQDGQVVFENGYGSANLEHGVPITPETVLSTGSVGKQFTAFAIAVLADRGQLALDDQVATHVPGFRVGQPVTLRHLLHHTSGVRDTWGLLGLAGRRQGDLVSQEVALD
ncbi:serine hydrolase domain-containing protein, partial [Rubrivirga sp.]|uniref:serine hydrolase domain-containing protein n=1 Tax=Rubrivirga sp. TaxID=1885344 RepID=UPI003C794B1B